MVIDYCKFGSLSAYKHTFKGNESDAKILIAEIILAIQYLHTNNVLYRDLKPSNILVFEDGHVKLSDFGLSKEISEQGKRGRGQSFCGSPAYLPPEVLDNAMTSFATDIYGIGCLLYELLVGAPPFFDKDIE